MRFLILFLVAFSGCVAECPPIPPARFEQAPKLLSETGLSDPTVREYEPRFPFWSDGAQKRRWIRLPPGTRIDTSDSDEWQFPVGTRLWKEFSVDGKRVETRLMQRTDDDWLQVAYAWNQAQTDAERLPTGATRVLGTSHSIPAADQCQGCHLGTTSRVLGFSGVQLEGTALSPKKLYDEGWLTDAPPSYQLPGDDKAQAALGYLHANCSHCHNVKRPSTGADRCWHPERQFDFQLRLATLTSVRDTNALTTIGKSGNPTWPVVLEIVGRTSAQGGMPPLAKDVVDRKGVETLKAFVDSL